MPSAGSAWYPKKIGAYIVDREIGRGGMGVVYLGYHEETRESVAIKIMPTNMPATMATKAVSALTEPVDIPVNPAPMLQPPAQMAPIPINAPPLSRCFRWLASGITRWKERVANALDMAPTTIPISKEIVNP